MILSSCGGQVVVKKIGTSTLKDLNTTQRYDYIITGGGLAGLSLLVHMINSHQFDDKKILLVEREEKKQNDRTWCFWERQPGLFESIVKHRWEKVWFHGEDYSNLLTLSPYVYKLINGIDFYEYCLAVAKTKSNIEIRYAAIERIVQDEQGAAVIMDGQRASATYVFNSIIFDQPSRVDSEIYLLQHFKGWVIETVKPVFTPPYATLMDFRVGQEQGTSFVYIMPFEINRALVEYTVFSHQLLPSTAYDSALRDYISNMLDGGDYSVSSEEFGVIPMTNHRFPTHRGNIIYIGTAGGQTKPSSGYTFQFVQKHSAAIVDRLLTGFHPAVDTQQKRFRFYDSTLLDILDNKTVQGKKIFSDLFRKNDPALVLKFLDNESNLREELSIISSLPAWPFLKAAFRQV